MSDVLKALTICQPYAELIMRGLKRVENRTWPTSYRGPLLIHAGKSRQWLAGDNFGIPLSEMDFGFLVGGCRLVDCVQCHSQTTYASFSPDVNHRYPWLADHEHTEGPWCWVLENVQRFETPIPYRGAQGLFNVPASVVVRQALAPSVEKPQ